MNTYEINGTYGSNQTPCTILVADQDGEMAWYCVEGSSNVNLTRAHYLVEGVDIEQLSDMDAFTWPDGVNSLEELELAVEA